ncbi:uncharacterized protein LOC120279440 [Dioscorea cayenensis subsp. rotundata]|uniref:Uncharacterized protein LOC120279440 n=1 Tax=Dioscorea cayennensis subsp. rotundata TaxID=55577 RepID=A0AB40CUQ4_DIOCR|nr:uncharacterized protein LOC120279440 [Dioscorea cayenensis subsp. rotundata]
MVNLWWIRMWATCSCRKWELSGIPCGHAISVIYYNRDKPENFLNDCYKVSTFLNTYRHTLNPTQDRQCWPKSNQGPMVPPDPMQKKRGRKTMLRREPGEETSGFKHGRVSKKGVSMKCSVCGAKGHNKRHHKVSQVIDGITGEQEHQQPVEATNPMDIVDPQVLQAHFEMVDSLVGANQQAGDIRQGQNVSEPLSQVQQIAKEPTNKNSTGSNARNHFLRSQGRQKDNEDRSKEGGLSRRKRNWVPPGTSTVGAAKHGRK